MTATFYIGDAVTVMNTLSEKSVDLILSSPPFLSLRSYLPQDHPDKVLEGGSQASPGEYIDWLLDVVEACARVLAPHGSLCFELGDTYSGGGESGWERYPSEIRNYRDEKRGRASADGLLETRRDLTSWPLAKSLSLIPETFRWAMVYGHNPHTGRKTEPWRLRNVIRWVRPNPPVGALGDKFRPATSELMVFCKAKDRFFDLDAVREPSVNPIGVGVRPTQARVSGNDINDHRDKLGPFTRDMQMAGAPPLDWWNISEDEQERTTQIRMMIERLQAEVVNGPPMGPLDWWNIPPGGYPGAHYAVWPPELLVKPIKAMCPESVCRVCGEASRRIVENSYENSNRGDSGIRRDIREPDGRQNGTNMFGKPHLTKTVETLGFSDCGHDDYRNGIVLDPFAGSGTTLSVATGHGRDAIGIDLDERNYDLALDRVGPLVLSRAA